MKTGIWESKRLERELRRRSASDMPADGSLRALRGGGAPTWTTAVNLEAALPGADVVYWTNHPIFHLLDCTVDCSTTAEAVTYAMNSIWGTVRDHFWPRARTGSQPGSADPQLMALLQCDAALSALDDRASTQALSPMDWLVLNMAAYCIVKRQGHPALAVRTAENTHLAFADASLRYPHLLMNRVGLERVLAARIWEVEGITHRPRAVLTDANSLIGRHVRQLFAPGLIALAQDREAMALTEPNKCLTGEPH